LEVVEDLQAAAWHVNLVSVPPLQVLLQDVPSAYSLHEPVPLHTPVVPQVDAACCAHSLSGSRPVRIGPQRPSDPVPFFARLQAMQRPPHVVVQHTPSRQNPKLHSASRLQATPWSRFAMHWLPVQ
jgi:hypothetical protein